MKKSIVLMILVVLFLTGCAQDDLENYLTAEENTMAIDRGTMILDLKVDIDYEEEGLTEEELVNLSYYDEIEFSMENNFDNTDDMERFINHIYMNFGGMGFDLEVYKDEEKIYMRVPILNAYMKLEDFASGNYEDYEESYEDYGEVFKALGQQWQEILEEENVVKGDKTYLTTSEGQVKTTTYTINLNKEQLNSLVDITKEALLGEEGIIGDTLDKNALKDFEKEAILNEINRFFESVTMKDFQGVAYVDFDNRLIKETVNIKLEFEDPNKGEARAIDLEYTLSFDNLGEPVQLEFPDVTDDMWINQDELDMLTDTMPITN